VTHGCRKIQIVDFEHDKLVASHSTYVLLGDGDLNVPSVALKVQESVNSDDSFVLLDSKNQEMADCPATQGLSVSLVYFCFCRCEYTWESLTPSFVAWLARKVSGWLDGSSRKIWLKL